MSKEKLIPSSSTARGRYAYRIPRYSPAAGNDACVEKVVPTKRVCLGGRGREWAAESLKLLETMSNLEDAKLFLEPMNPLKYPEYYNLIRDPIDLSKIMLKFHGGAYPGLIHFSEDMNSMFDNYKRFFKDSSTETYHQVRRLSSWFDTELDQIKCKWYRICDNGSRIAIGSANGSTPRSGSLEARIQAIEAENRRIVNLAAKPTTVPLRLQPVDQRSIKLPQTLNAIPISNSSSTGSINGTPLLAFRLASDTSATPSSASIKLPTTGNSQPIILVSKSSSENGSRSSQGGLVYMCADWPPPKQSNLKPISTVGIGGGGSVRLESSGQSLSSLPAGTSLPVAVPPKIQSQSTVPETGLKLDVGNIWFGTARNQPIHPVTVDEDGFHFLLRNGDIDVPFMIGRDEIIKCAAYFGNLRKHTLFLFVLPNCVRRLLFLGEEFTLSSLIIMFPPALTQSQIAKLVYLFWRMSRLSMFGELFCEIDQKSAVALLGNIKPTIISNIADKYKDALSSNLDMHQSTVKCAVGGRSYAQAAGGGGGDSLSQALVLTDTGNQFISDSADAFSEVDCKVEPVDNEENSSCPQVNEDLVELGLTSIVDSKCLALSDSMLSDEAVEDNQDSTVSVSTKSDVIRKRLKIRYRPGILKHSKRRKVEEKQQEKYSEEARNSDQHQTEEESDNQFTIIEWFPDDEAGTGDEESVVSEEASENSDLQAVNGFKDENDLEIVAATNESETEMEMGVGVTSVICNEEEGREDLVMTGEKINIRCPITQQIMEYPVKNIHCNHCYDKQGVEDLIKNRGDKAKCPVTGCSNTLSLQMKDVKHDDQLLFYIQQKLTQMASR